MVFLPIMRCLFLLLLLTASIAKTWTLNCISFHLLSSVHYCGCGFSFQNVLAWMHGILCEVAKKEHHRYRVFPGHWDSWVFSAVHGWWSVVSTVSFMQLSAELPARAVTGRCEAGCYFQSQGKVLFSFVTDKLIFLFYNFLAFKNMKLTTSFMLVCSNGPAFLLCLHKSMGCGDKGYYKPWFLHGSSTFCKPLWVMRKWSLRPV